LRSSPLDHRLIDEKWHSGCDNEYLGKDRASYQVARLIEQTKNVVLHDINIGAFGSPAILSAPTMTTFSPSIAISPQKSNLTKA
tara:strand:- start:5561 stop:5812 length:252 start_codon:yes stop_codon:yes gene_type:complete